MVVQSYYAAHLFFLEDQNELDRYVSVLSAVIAVLGTLAGVWLSNWLGQDRARKERVDSERRHVREVRARLLDSLLHRRLEAHEAVLRAIFDLELACHQFNHAPSSDTLYEHLVEIRDRFRLTLAINSVWLRTAALESLSQIMSDVDQHLSSRDRFDRLDTLFYPAQERIRWSLGVEDLDKYLSDIWASKSDIGL